MPYHVIVRSKDPLHDNTRLDLSEKELLDQIVKPYNEGTPLFCGGTEIHTDNIAKIRISFTEEDSSEYYPIIEEELAEERRARKLVKTIPVEWHIANRGRDLTDKYIKGPPSPPKTLTPITPEMAISAQTPDPRRVWVVHGRDLERRDQMHSFLRLLDLHPMEWEETRILTDEPTPYIGNILDIGFNIAQAFVILITGDDEGRLKEEFIKDDDQEHEKNLTPQARQNVIFEAGMAWGRFAKRTIIVEFGSTRPFTNISGLHTVRMNDSPQKKHELANRLDNAGCAVNRDGSDWLRSGIFT